MASATEAPVTDRPEHAVAQGNIQRSASAFVPTETIHRRDTHDFIGRFQNPPPPFIVDRGQFIHLGSYDVNGSKVAVVYTSEGCDWILAWFIPADGQNNLNKVYVEVRAKETEINWTEIELKLNTSGSSSESEGPCGKAEATISQNTYINTVTALFDDKSA